MTLRYNYASSGNLGTNEVFDSSDSADVTISEDESAEMIEAYDRSWCEVSG